MVTEAAMLGTPAIKRRTFDGPDLGEFQRLADADLARITSGYDETVTAATGVLDDPDASDRWERRRDEFMAATTDLTSLLVDIATDPGTARDLDALTPRTPSATPRSA